MIILEHDATREVTSEMPSLNNSHEIHRQNNFGLLRIVFSLLVLFSHCYPLTQGFDANEPLSVLTKRLSLGSLSVDGFFLLSGYLISQSWVRSRSANSFVVKRLLRIYPGYLVALLVSLLIGTVCSSPNSMTYVKEIYWTNDAALRAVLFLDYGILDKPQAFAGNPIGGVNGSMWTLRPELECYAVVLGLGVFGLMRNRRVLIVTTAVFYVLYVVNSLALHGTTHLSCRFFTFFFIGASASTISPHNLRLSTARTALVAAILGAGVFLPALFPVVYPAGFSIAVLGIALSESAPYSRLLMRYDLSYGIYLYAFPIQQTAVWLLDLRSPIGLFVISLPLTLTAGYLSWVFVESPMLRFKGQIVDGISQN